MTTQATAPVVSSRRHDDEGSSRVFATIGRRVLPASQMRPDQIIRPAAAGRIFMLMVVILIPTIIKSTHHILVEVTQWISAGTGSEVGVDTSPQILIVGLLGAGFAFFFPRAVFRSAASTKTRDMLNLPPSMHGIVERDVIVYSPTLIAVLIGAGYVRDLQWMFFLFSWVSIFQAIVVYFRRGHTGRATSIFSATLHVFLTMMAFTAAWLIAAPDATTYTKSVYAIDIPIADPLYGPRTWFLLLLFVLAAVAATSLRGFTKALIYQAVGMRNPITPVYTVFDPRRIAVAMFMALSAWLVYVVSEMAGVGEDTLGIVLAVSTWLGLWAVFWSVSALHWMYEARRILLEWTEQQIHEFALLSTGAWNPAVAQNAAINSAARAASILFGADHVKAIIPREFSVTGKRVITTMDSPQMVTSRVEDGRLFRIVSASQQNSEVDLAIINVYGQEYACMFLSRTRLITRRFEKVLGLGVTVPMLASGDPKPETVFRRIFDKKSGAFNTNTLQLFAADMLNGDNPRTAGRTLFLAGIQIDLQSYLQQASSYDPDGGLMLMQLTRALLSSDALNGVQAHIATDTDTGRIWLVGVGTLKESIRRIVDETRLAVEDTPVTLTGAGISVFVNAHTAYACHGVDHVDFDGLTALVEQKLARHTMGVSSIASALTDAALNEFFVHERLPEHDSAVDRFNRDAEKGALQPHLYPIYPLNDATASEGYWLAYDWHTDLPVGTIEEEKLIEYIDKTSCLMPTATEYFANAAYRLARSLDANFPNTGEQRIVFQMPPTFLVNANGYTMKDRVAALYPLLNDANRSRFTLLFDGFPADSIETLGMLHDGGLKVAVVANPRSVISPEVTPFVSEVVFRPAQVSAILDGNRQSFDAVRAMFFQTDVRLHADTVAPQSNLTALARAGFTTASGQIPHRPQTAESGDPADATLVFHSATSGN